jgi:uncharacterized metal-binding protein
MHRDFPDAALLYGTEEATRLAQHAAAVEGLGYGHWTRLRETAEFAVRMGYDRIGVAYCPDMHREAVLVATFLRDHMLSTTLAREQPDCDPLGQAEMFATLGTKLNVSAGMCVGHEAVFIRASQAPVTVLVARDERLQHNPAAALYTADSYLHATLYGRSSNRQPLPYEGVDAEKMLAAARQLLPESHARWCRVREAMEFARLLGVTHIGLSFCVGLRREAAVLSKVLEANGFHVSSICCKSGAVPKEALGIPEAHKLRPNEPEMACNPLAQAELLNRAGVQFALILGQCVGHDSATLARLEAPAACIIAKDRVLGHNTVAALYRLEG